MMFQRTATDLRTLNVSLSALINLDCHEIPYVKVALYDMFGNRNEENLRCLKFKMHL